MIRGDGGVGSGPDADLILALGVHHHAGARGGKVRALGNAGHVHARGLELPRTSFAKSSSPVAPMNLTDSHPSLAHAYA